MPAILLTVLLILLGVPTTRVASNESETLKQLVGLWGAERSFGHPVSGELLITDNKGVLTALVAGRSAPVQVDQFRVSFSLPKGEGTYRGLLSKDQQSIRGHWIQPPGAVETYEFATPTDLVKLPSGGWHGTLTPFQERLSLYLLINQEPDGLMSVIMRNPERNIGVTYRLDHLKVTKDSVRFYDSQKELVLTGSLHFAEDAGKVAGISLRTWHDQTFDFTRRTRESAPGFYPRPNTIQYRYRQPNSTLDGWPVAHANSVGVKPQALAAFVQNILDTETNSHRTPYIQDVVLARHGKLILDEHFYGYHGNIAHDSRSASKSITAMAVGTAVADGSLSAETKVYPLFPESTGNPDSRKEALKVKHLLTMSSGLECDDNNPDSLGNEGNMQYQGEQTDWQRFTLDLPLVRKPGASAVYCSGGINLLVGVVNRSTNQWYPEFFRSRLADPLNIHTYHMNLDPLQRGYGGGGLRLRPRDFLKFGQTMLDGGIWKQQRILSKAWVDASLTPQSSINSPNDYGYAWWRAEHKIRGNKIESWSATGNGGQLIIIVPKYDLSLVFNGGNYNNFPTWIAWRDELLPKLIEAAIADPN